MEKFDIVAEDYFNRIGEFFDELGETITSNGEAQSPFNHMVRRMFFDLKVGVRNKENSHAFSDIKEHTFELDLVSVNNGAFKPSEVLTEALASFVKETYSLEGTGEHVDIIKFTPRMGKTIFAIPNQYKDKTVIILTWFKSTVEKLLSKHGLTTLVSSYDEQPSNVEIEEVTHEPEVVVEEPVTTTTLSELEESFPEEVGVESPEEPEYYPEAEVPYSEDAEPVAEEPAEDNGDVGLTYTLDEDEAEEQPEEPVSEDSSVEENIPLLQFGRGIRKTYLSQGGVLIPLDEVMLVQMAKNEEAIRVFLGHGVEVSLKDDNAVDFLRAYKNYMM